MGYFPIYDYEYGRVRYDDYHHASHDTQGSADLPSLRATSSTMWVQGGVNHLGIHSHTCGSCVRKYYTSNFVRTRGHPYDGRS